MNTYWEDLKMITQKSYLISTHPFIKMMNPVQFYKQLPFSNKMRSCVHFSIEIANQFYLSTETHMSVHKPSWILPQTIDSPPERAYFPIVHHQNFIYCFGGFNFSTEYDDAYRLNLTSLKWESINLQYEKKPSKLSGHSGMKYKNCFYMYGGYHHGCKNDLIEWNLDTNEWKIIKTNGVTPLERNCASLILYKHYFYIFGGECIKILLLFDIIFSV